MDRPQDLPPAHSEQREPRRHRGLRSRTSGNTRLAGSIGVRRSAGYAADRLRTALRVRTNDGLPSQDALARARAARALGGGTGSSTGKGGVAASRRGAGGREARCTTELAGRQGGERGTRYSSVRSDSTRASPGAGERPRGPWKNCPREISRPGSRWREASWLRASRAVDELTPRDRLVVVGRRIESLKLRELAERLGCSMDRLVVVGRRIESLKLRELAERLGCETDRDPCPDPPARMPRSPWLDGNRSGGGRRCSTANR